jgi:hypothetical protein
MATQRQEIPISDEIDRFIRLHDGMARMNRSLLEMAPPDRLDWVPSKDAIHQFGDGRTPVTIRNLFIHVAVAENVWIMAWSSVASRVRASPPLETLSLLCLDRLHARFIHATFQSLAIAVSPRASTKLL